jgi:predicted DNA-binding transcriptional regulator AlpA
MRHQLSLLGKAQPASVMPTQSNASLVLQWMLIETYGPRLNIEQLATVLGITKGAVYNQISADKFPIATYVDGGKRWADCRDVAEHFERCRQRAHIARRTARTLITRLPPPSVSGS